jgi:hypothetical protein
MAEGRCEMTVVFSASIPRPRGEASGNSEGTADLVLTDRLVLRAQVKVHALPDQVGNGLSVIRRKPPQCPQLDFGKLNRRAHDNMITFQRRRAR